MFLAVGCRCRCCCCCCCWMKFGVKSSFLHSLLFCAAFPFSLFSTPPSQHFLLKSSGKELRQMVFLNICTLIQAHRQHRLKYSISTHKWITEVEVFSIFFSFSTITVDLINWTIISMLVKWTHFKRFSIVWFLQKKK